VPIPTVHFSDERLANGLRLIIAPDHVAPVASVNLWYNVGSKHEVPGKTGFAHLFEHVMFQGSGHVAKAEHFALIQAAGGTTNASTWLDRTNYFENVPSHEVELALWLEADRMGTLLVALNQENLDNQRDVVKNEKRSSYDNRPYGSWTEKLQGHLFPSDHPYHHPTIGSMADLDAASVDDVAAFFRTYYAPNNAVVTVVGDVEADQVRRWVERYFGRIPANPSIPPLADLSLPPTLGRESRETVPDKVPLPRIYWGFRSPVLGDRRMYALEIACQILAGGKGSRLHRRLVREERLAQDVAIFALGFIGGSSLTAGWATARPGTDLRRLEDAYWEELTRLTTEPVSDDELARAKALVEADELGALERADERADRLSMYATLLDDPDLINRTLARYLAVDAEAIRAVAASTFREDNRAVLTYLPERGSADDVELTDETAAASDDAETSESEVAAVTDDGFTGDGG
jgi:predicted Zn-dependent peptidase